jgi:DNA modification methylase
MLDIRHGDNKELIKDLENDSIDLIYFNPPFGITKKYWDKDLDWDSLFPEMWRVLKPNGTIIIHCSISFNWKLVRQEWSKDLRYCYYWNKKKVTNWLNTKWSPLRCVEEIFVYSKKPTKTTFNYVKNPEYKRKPSENLAVDSYYSAHRSMRSGGVNKGTPTHYLEIPATTSDFTRPDELIRFIIETHSNTGETVLDPTCGLGRCGFVAESLNRKWIGFEIRTDIK